MSDDFCSFGENWVDEQGFDCIKVTVVIEDFVGGWA